MCVCLRGIVTDPAMCLWEVCVCSKRFSGCVHGETCRYTAAPPPNTRLDDFFFVIFGHVGITLSTHTHTWKRTQQEPVKKGCSGLFGFFKHVTAPRQEERDKDGWETGGGGELVERRGKAARELQEGDEERICVLFHWLTPQRRIRAKTVAKVLTFSF